jgi:membrane fusion protein (multidrug efflux system)
MMKRLTSRILWSGIVGVLVLSTVYSVYIGFDLGDAAVRPAAAETGNVSLAQSAAGPPETAESPAEAAPPAVPYEAAAPATPYAESEIRAQLQPVEYTTLASEIPGKIQRIHVKEGMTFRKGDLLMTLDCALYKAEKEKARVVLKAAERIARANQRLFELRSIGEIEMETSVADAEKARADLLVTSTRVSKCVIQAPFDGKVVEQKEREEEFVQSGQPILDILNGSAMELEFLVPSKWLTWLSETTPLDIHIDETDSQYPALIKRIGAKADPVSRSVKITAVIAGKYPELTPGMSGKVTVGKPQT